MCVQPVMWLLRVFDHNCMNVGLAFNVRNWTGSSTAVAWVIES